jgi:hypothetical protein
LSLSAPTRDLAEDLAAGLCMSLNLAVLFASAGNRRHLADQIAAGRAPRQAVKNFVRDGRLWAVIEFDDEDTSSLQIALDCWPLGAS